MRISEAGPQTILIFVPRGSSDQGLWLPTMWATFLVLLVAFPACFGASCRDISQSTFKNNVDSIREKWVNSVVLEPGISMSLAERVFMGVFQAVHRTENPLDSLKIAVDGVRTTFNVDPSPSLMQHALFAEFRALECDTKQEEKIFCELIISFFLNKDSQKWEDLITRLFKLTRMVKNQKKALDLVCRAHRSVLGSEPSPVLIEQAKTEYAEMASFPLDIYQKYNEILNKYIEDVEYRNLLVRNFFQLFETFDEAILYSIKLFLFEIKLTQNKIQETLHSKDQTNLHLKLLSIKSFINRIFLFQYLVRMLGRVRLNPNNENLFSRLFSLLLTLIGNNPYPIPPGINQRINEYFENSTQHYYLLKYLFCIKMKDYFPDDGYPHHDLVMQVITMALTAHRTKELLTLTPLQYKKYAEDEVIKIYKLKAVFELPEIPKNLVNAKLPQFYMQKIHPMIVKLTSLPDFIAFSQPSVNELAVLLKETTDQEKLGDEKSETFPISQSSSNSFEAPAKVELVPDLEEKRIEQVIQPILPAEAESSCTSKASSCQSSEPNGEASTKEIMLKNLIDDDEEKEWKKQIADFTRKKQDQKTKSRNNLSLIFNEDPVAFVRSANKKTLQGKTKIFGGFDTQDFILRHDAAGNLYHENWLSSMAFHSIEKPTTTYTWVFNPEVVIDGNLFKFICQVFGVLPGRKSLSYDHFISFFYGLAKLFKEKGPEFDPVASLHGFVFKMHYFLILGDYAYIPKPCEVHPEHQSSGFNHKQVKKFLSNAGLHPYFFKASA